MFCCWAPKISHHERCWCFGAFCMLSCLVVLKDRLLNTQVRSGCRIWKKTQCTVQAVAKPARRTHNVWLSWMNLPSIAICTYDLSVNLSLTALFQVIPEVRMRNVERVGSISGRSNLPFDFYKVIELLLVDKCG